ncbi:hypothetical protein HGRIS_014010 [Hohenbuehelia grisea]|uniref:Copper-fist domain-containing protein n=1 Tax=Hohenbuehelia grisea TaxID=104357 RepID=A0ABR3JU44_9AGAR
MVFVNNKKYACESCIKGHRSSSCHHTERPLFEVKKKGRPISQCEKCRELRQSRRVHSKCICNKVQTQPQPTAPSPASKARRFVAIAPALPNGLRDVFQQNQNGSSDPPDVRQRVDTLLNPCKCKSIRKCKCRDGSNASGNPHRQAGLEALARAAALCHADDVELHSPPRTTTTLASRSAPESSTSPNTLSLPPIIHIPSILPSSIDIPSMSKIDSLAGSGCTCGFTCACPGCEEHQTPNNSSSAGNPSSSRRRCADGCGNCVDPSLVSLPGFEPSPGSSILDQFYARAASLPVPSNARRMGTPSGWTLDPTNVLVYPSSALNAQERSAAFGLVNVPKLECCAGKCGCPNGRCGCGTSCDGCCADQGGEDIQSANEGTSSVQVSEPAEPAPAPVVVRSCCAGKR